MAIWVQNFCARLHIQTSDDSFFHFFHFFFSSPFSFWGFWGRGGGGREAWTACKKLSVIEIWLVYFQPSISESPNKTPSTLHERSLSSPIPVTGGRSVASAASFFKFTRDARRWCWPILKGDPQTEGPVDKNGLKDILKAVFLVHWWSSFLNTRATVLTKSA